MRTPGYLARALKDKSATTEKDRHRQDRSGAAGLPASAEELTKILVAG
jgi:hypothetical protein